MDASECRALLGHAEWADALVWNAVAALKQEDCELLEKLHHLHLVQWSYLHVWRGEPVALPEPSPVRTSGALRTWARDYYRELTSYLAAVGDGMTAREVRLPWAERLGPRFGAGRSTTWSDSVLHVALHTSHHRGQVAQRLRMLGTEPPLTDFIAWIWMNRPVADWGEDDAA
jgi:uncharacterized damage-inducible protein DinB